MKHTFLLYFCSIICAFSQQISPRNANYQIDVSLNPDSKTLLGTETLVWRNTTNTPATELQFHLYLNAFKNSESTFMRESGGRLRGLQSNEHDKNEFGNIYISSFKVKNGENLYSKIEYIQPDNQNINDQTVIKVKLNNTVLPNQSITLELGFKAQLPKIMARTGWGQNDFFMVGQWFPKIGVFEQKAAENIATWNCHQFHAHTEFYADFGNYLVNITLPKKYIVAGSGIKVNEKNISKEYKTVSFLGTDIHDFAWTASTNFKVFNKTYQGINIQAFMQPEHADQANRYFESVIHAIDYCQMHIGKYPYQTLSLIDPPAASMEAGGMEYPTLITCDSFWGVGKWGKMAEVVAIHEFSHQYFYGLLASNEFEASWMDEGFTQYTETQILDKYYPHGSVCNILGFTANDFAIARNGYISMPNLRISPINQNAWQYPNDSYAVLSYYKTAVMLKNLSNLIGSNNMDLVFKTYFERFKFKHPKPQDFINVVNEIAEKHTKYKDMNWYFEQTIFKTNVCDYAVSSIQNAARKQKPHGSFMINKLGDMTLPTEILIKFKDGKSQLINWDGESSTKHYSFNNRIQEVIIDPKMKNVLDINLINNSKSDSNPIGFASKYGVKAIFWVEQILNTFFGLI